MEPISTKRKFSNFLDDLEKLCLENEVQLAPEMCDSLVVYDLYKDKNPLQHIFIEDKTDGKV